MNKIQDSAAAAPLFGGASDSDSVNHNQVVCNGVNCIARAVDTASYKPQRAFY